MDTLVYCENAQTFIQHVTFVCTVILALATLISLVFTIVIAIIGKSVYALNNDIKAEHDKIKASVAKEKNRLVEFTGKSERLMEEMEDALFRINTEPSLLKKREFIDAVIASLNKGKSVEKYTSKIISDLYDLSELGSIEDMKRLVRMREVAGNLKLDTIADNATQALLRIAEKQ
ncbi:hypothetical protein KAR91_77065 [Candidatus Pacearchaeota archaeon]|nr:hypothetical protein [Candidatus Pacearchaeota archaeon]